MRRIEWQSLIRVLAWIVALAFLVGAVALLVLFLELTGPAPVDPNAPLPRGDAFIAEVLDVWEWERSRAAFDVIGSVAIAVGFLSLAGLGHALARVTDADDARRGLVSVTFIAAGVLGAASQVGWIGATEVATSTEICECGFMAEEVIARLMILNVTSHVVSWGTNSAALLLAVGLIPLSRMGREAGMSNRWEWLSIGLAALLVVTFVVSLFPVLPVELIQVVPVDLILTILVTAIVVPAWAIWLALSARSLLTEAGDAEPMES